MKNLFPKKQEKKTIKLKNEDVELIPLTLSESVEVFFLLVPYIKILKRIKDEYKGSSTLENFQFITETLLGELDRDVLVEILSIILHKPYVFVSDITIKDIVNNVFIILQENSLFELYALFNKLGVFD